LRANSPIYPIRATAGGGVCLLVNLVLLVAIAVMTVGLTVLGGYMSTSYPKARAAFVIVGPLLTVLIIAQGVRQLSAQSSADDAYMKLMQQNRDDRHRSDTKIDSLFALLLPKVSPGPVSSLRTKAIPTPSIQQQAKPEREVPPPPSAPQQAKLSIAQKPQTSSREDAPYKTEVVVQTTTEFPSLKLLVQCDKPLVEANPHLASGGVLMMTSQGVVRDHPKVFIFTYGSAAPPFGPGNPLIVDVWSKELVRCDQVATY
jgi:hypothetical protein